MPVLINVAAYGDFVDKEKTKLGIEDGFDFTIRLDEEEAVDFSDRNPKAKDFKLIVRISCTGNVEDAVYSYKTDDPDIDIENSVDEEHEDAVTELVNVMGLGDIATSVTREDMMSILHDISEVQPYDDIVISFGDFYDKYLEAYNGYTMIVFAQSRPLAIKHVRFSDASESDRWHPVIADGMSREQVRTAKEISRKYNIIDDYSLESNEKLEEKLYSISEKGRKEGSEAVRNKSEDPIIPVYTDINPDNMKFAPTGVLPRVRVRLRDELEKNSHK